MFWLEQTKQEREAGHAASGGRGQAVGGSFTTFDNSGGLCAMQQCGLQFSLLSVHVLALLLGSTHLPSSHPGPLLSWFFDPSRLIQIQVSRCWPPVPATCHGKPELHILHSYT